MVLIGADVKSIKLFVNEFKSAFLLSKPTSMFVSEFFDKLKISFSFSSRND